MAMEAYGLVVAEAKRRRQDGEDLESVLAFLRSSQISIIDAVKIVREVEACGLGEAKDSVHHSAAWSDLTAPQERAHESIVSDLENSEG